MKNKLKILTILALGIFLFSTCQKNPDLPMPALKKGVIPLIKKDETKNLIIFDNNIAGFTGSVTCDLYPYIDKPKSMDLMVTLNNDPAKSAAAVANITSWPVKYDFTIAALVTLLPGLNNISEIKTNDFFRFYVNTTLEDGTVINGNDTLYAAYSSGIYNQPGSSPEVTYPVVCGYEPALAAGNYYAYSAPSEWNSKGDITIALDPVDNTKVYVTGLASIDGLVEDKGPLVMHVDPITFEVTADKTVICSDFWGYVNGAYEGTGTFNSCTGEYTMDFTISDDSGPWGSFKYSLTRK